MWQGVWTLWCPFLRESQATRLAFESTHSHMKHSPWVSSSWGLQNLLLSRVAEKWNDPGSFHFSFPYRTDRKRMKCSGQFYARPSRIPKPSGRIFRLRVLPGRGRSQFGASVFEGNPFFVVFKGNHQENRFILGRPLIKRRTLAVGETCAAVSASTFCFRASSRFGLKASLEGLADLCARWVCWGKPRVLAFGSIYFYEPQPNGSANLGVKRAHESGSSPQDP